MSEKILLVDDEPNVLQGYKRHLRKKYDIELAIGGAAAVEAVKAKGPFAVVVSDMQMPEMSGVELLSKIQMMNEYTVRIMLTGNADQKTAVDAVNEGNIFRFLSKPCDSEQLAKSLDAGLEMHRLQTAEAELLNKTLSGSVRMLTQVLSLAMPEAFGLTQEARSLVRGIAEQVGIGPLWQIEMASMLMRVGCVSLPKDVLTNYLTHKRLSSEDEKLVMEAPTVGYNLVSAIPRLQPVADLILHQNDPPQDPTPIACRIMRVVGDYQRFHTGERPLNFAIKLLRDSGNYDQEIVELLAKVLADSRESIEVNVEQLTDGMVLEKNVQDLEGRILIAAGNEIHETIIQKLTVLRRSAAGVREPIHVRAVYTPSDTEEAQTANA
ncbi:MAG: response regulator [Rubripirellula sp.]